MMEVKEIVTGVVAELGGKYWGVLHEDGHATNMGFGKIQTAEISDPRYCKKPEDLTYAGSPYEKELRLARLLPVTKTTTYVVGE